MVESKKNDRVNVRYAPSPTGIPHIGNIRTAIFDWIYSKSKNGQFIVRIEDTDRSRYDPHSEQSIFDSLKWLGLNWDQGPDKTGINSPYVQSKRKHFYIEAAEKLVKSGDAYYDDTTPEELEALRKRQKAAGEPPRYDGRGRFRSEKDISNSRDKGLPIVIRFKVQKTGNLEFYDEVRGKIAFNLSEIDDFVILKSDGMPTYHLAHIVDDFEMGITHVIRGEEWIPSTPKHQLIQIALNIKPPKYVHVPLIFGKDKSKLSKRHGAKSVLEYRDEGYLPEALFNYLVLLGWSPGDDTEIMGKSEIVKRFSINRISESPAVFDPEKLEWMNGIYIRNLSTDNLAQRILPYLEKPEKDGGFSDTIERPINSDLLIKIVPHIRERLKTLLDVKEMIDFFYLEGVCPKHNELIPKTMDSASTIKCLYASLNLIKDAKKFSAQCLEKTFRLQAEKLNLKPGQMFSPIRISVTGKRIAPPLFETLEILGKEKCFQRIKNAIDMLEK